MALLDQLFGTQQPQDAGGLVQSILSQRFQPLPQDAAQATYQSVFSPQPVSSYTTQGQRMEGPMKVAGTLGQLNMSQIALQRLQEEQMRDQMMWGMELGKLPQMGGQQPPIGFPTGQPSQPQQAGPQQQNSNMPPVGFQTANPKGQANLTPEQEREDLSQLYPAPGGASSPQGGQVPLTSDQGQADYTPIKTGFGAPFTQGLPEGQQWATDKQGNQVAIQIPGTIMKGANGEVLTPNPEGQPTQTIPKNPQARSALENNLQQIEQKATELDKEGGTINENKGFLSNKATQIAGSTDITLPIGEGISLPTGGQTLLQGSHATTLRNDISALVKQTLPLYMQAMGITPGMERAVSAQKMLADALGGGVDKSYQHMLFSLGNLSKQAGTGELSSRLNKKDSSNQGGGIQEGATATGPGGHKITFSKGAWIDSQTGAPIK